jgi:enoyl-CoA hydratase/carnithine racemase
MVYIRGRRAAQLPQRLRDLNHSIQRGDLMPAFSYSIDAGVATFVFSNPPQNRLSAELIGGLGEAVGKVREDRSVRAVLLRAEGENFGFGGDIFPWLDVTPAQMAARIAQVIQLGDAFERLPVPIVAAVQGRCSGGSFELVLRTDIIVAGESARFSHSEQTIGVVTFLGGAQRVAERAGRTRAALWAMTSEPVPAVEMLAAGVISKVVPDAEVQSTAEALVRKLAKGPTLAHAGHKRLLDAWSRGGAGAADQLLPEMAERVMSSVDARQAVAIAIDALKRGLERPEMNFEGR